MYVFIKAYKAKKVWKSDNFENLRILKIWEFWKSKNFENLKISKL